MVRSCLKNSFHWDSWYVCLFLSMTQQKRKLRIYISNTYTPSKPDGEEAEKVSSWELRVEGKLLEEVSKQHSHYIWIFLLCSTITRVVWLPSISGSVIVFLHSHSALVGLCPWLWPSNQMCVYSSPPLHPTTPNTLAHKLMLSFETGNWNHWPLHTISCHASPPSINSLCHLGPHEEGFKKKKNFTVHFFSSAVLVQACVGVLHRVTEKERDVREGVKGVILCKHILTGLWRGRGVQQLFLVVYSFVLHHPQCGQS